MPISYDKLFVLLKERGKTEYWLRQNKISPSILSKLKHGTGGLDARTIGKLCGLLACQPGDILEYIPDAEGPQSPSLPKPNCSTETAAQKSEQAASLLPPIHRKEERENAPEKELAAATIDRYVDLQRIKKANGGYKNPELDYLLKVTAAKLSSLGVNAADIALP